jgi:hypothetical protein
VRRRFADDPGPVRQLRERRLWIARYRGDLQGGERECAQSSAGGDGLRIRLLALEGSHIADARREDAQRLHG